MFVSCLSYYIVILFPQNKPDTHWFGSRPLYIFTNPTSPHERRFCPRRFNSDCKEAILGKNINKYWHWDTKTAQESEIRSSMSVKMAPAARCVCSAWMYTLYTLVHIQHVHNRVIYFLNMVLDFFFLDLQRQNAEDRAEISGPHLKCVYIFSLCFLHSDTLPEIWWLSCHKSCLYMWPTFHIMFSFNTPKYQKTQQTLDYIWIMLPASHSPTLPFISEYCNQHTRFEHSQPNTPL